MNAERSQLLQAIEAQERLRGSVPDDVIDATVATLHSRLDFLDADEPSAERRRMATVLFADIAGFTALSETMDPELVATLMNELWTVVDEAIRGHHGRVDKHIGDAVMGVWGVDGARENDPELAVRSALALLAAFKEFRDDRELAIDMRVGVNTGLVLAGSVGTGRELSVTGDAVNVASRIEHMAPRGSVLISDDTYRHVRGLFDVARLKPATVKGKTDPLVTYVIERAKPRSFRVPTRGIEGIETRLIGRAEQLSILEDAFEQAVHDGCLQTVTLVGEAGIGKSRLLDEFTHWLELRPEPIYYLKGRSLPDLQGVARRLLREVFAARFEIYDDDSLTDVAHKLRTGLAPLGERDADIAGHWLGFELSHSTAVQDLSGADGYDAVGRAHLVRHLRAVLDRSPAVMLLEDVHWADRESLDTIVHLIEQLRGAPLLIVCLARPGFLERFERWADDTGSSLVPLDPLELPEQEALVHEILQRVDHLPEHFVKMIASNTDGNPFYVEELIKMLIDEGVIVTTGSGSWNIEASQLGDLQVPPTLTGVLQARLDGLSAPERITLQLSAVIGRTFWDDAVARLLEDAPASETALESPDQHLATLTQRELIRTQERSVMAGCAQFLFKHALLREAAYETVLLKDRSRLHAAAATWLEERAGDRLDEHLGPIADHLARAGDHDRAAQLLERSARNAAATGAVAAARDAYQEALWHRQQLGTDRGRDGTLVRIEMGRIMSQHGDLVAADGVLDAAQRDSQDLNAEELLCMALCYRAEAAIQRGDLEAANRCTTIAQPIAERTGGALLADVELVNAWLCNVASEPETAVAAATKAVERCEGLGDAQRMIEALNRLGVAEAQLGHHELSERHFTQALELARRIGNRMREASILGNLAATAHALSKSSNDPQLDVAIERYREALAVNEDLGATIGTIMALGNLAQAEVEAGEIRAAREHAHASLEAAWKRELAGEWAHATLVHGQLAIAEGRREEALRLIGAIVADPRTPRFDTELHRVFLMHSIDPTEAQTAMQAGAGIDLDSEIEGLIESGESEPLV